MSTIHQPVIANGEGVRATWAEVNLTRLSRNLQAIRAHVAPAKVMIIVKANAYGHGLAEVARQLGPQADYIGVAVLEEGIFLRELGVTAPILVLGGIWGDQVPQYLQHDLTLTASSVERLEQIDEAAARMGVKAKVHLKIDTGMERIGVHYYSAQTLQEAALKCKHVAVEGIFSHFANSDASDLSHARLQLERFQEVLRFYEKNSLPMPIRHMANSAAILQLPESHLDMVRPGIMLLRSVPCPPGAAHGRGPAGAGLEIAGGLFQSGQGRAPGQLRFHLAVRPSGAHCHGAGRVWRWVFPQDVQPGRRSSSAVKNIRRWERICMDQMMVNIEADSAFNGDEVTLMGESGGEAITAQELADWAGTIPYEILTNINTRVPRVYITEEEN